MTTTTVIGKVYKAKSAITSSELNMTAGDGIFANQNLTKGEIVCDFSGEVVDCEDIKYMDPTYCFSWQLGKGYKLIGDGKDGDLGHYCNSTHPTNPFVYQNATFDKRALRKTKNVKNQFNKRIKLPIIATRNIAKDEEIIIKYNTGYWKAMNNFLRNGIPSKSINVIERDNRAAKRAKIFA